jgi:hypothetical protein
MPIGAKMYEEAASKEEKADDAEAPKTDKKDKDGPVEGEVVDEK